FRGGYHDFIIRKGGLDIYPRLVAAEHHATFGDSQLESGIPELDKLLGGGIQRGTSTLVMGPAGSGKSSIASQYIIAAAERGDAGLIVAFDEGRNMLLRRCRAIGQRIDKHIDSGKITVKQVDPAEMSPGELSHMIRRAVENDNVKVVMIDSLNGYTNAMPEERFLTIQLHELLSYLGQRGVTTIMVVSQAGLIGSSMRSPGDTSYLADSVILLRYFELRGAVKKAISVMKKRGGRHEQTIRSLEISDAGIKIGEPLQRFRGILTGVPEQLDIDPTAGPVGNARG
ncbi:MAG: AAA family ATPase, partial [Elusimicrobia bacterium]|nr:AAA family ATPase [Elusimicrobiota bacterium]